MRVPDVARISSEMAFLERFHERLSVHYLAASCVDQIGSFFHTKEDTTIEQTICFGGQWGVDTYDIAFFDKLVEGHITYTQDIFFNGTQPPVVIIQRGNVKRF